MSFYSIGEFSKKINVSPNTLRNWEKSGKLVPLRTPGNKRKYTEEMYYQYIGKQMNSNQKETILYARVSSSGQKNDLENQKEYLKQFAIARGYTFSDILTDVGSALNYNRKNFLKLCEKVEKYEVEKVIITNKDRLVRFGFEFFEQFFARHGCELIIIDQREENSPEQELAEDLVNIVQHFSARIYGKKTYKSRKLNEKVSDSLKEDVKNLNTYQRESIEIT